MSATPHAAQESKARVLAAIGASADPVTVDALASATGLHPNTVRGHLDLLIASGSVERTPAPAQGRGRPRWLYRPVEQQASPFQFLAEALAAQLAQVSDPEVTEGVAQRWAAALPDLPAAHTPDEAVEVAAEALTKLGFTTEVSPVGDAIAVSGCPYASLIADNPVICDIHTALLVRVLGNAGQAVELESMDVWVRPEMCVARLRRTDLQPERTIVTAQAGVPADQGQPQ